MVFGSGATSSQTSFCVDQSDPALVTMYRKINACDAADASGISDVVSIVASVLSVVAALMGAGAAYRFKLCSRGICNCCGNVQ
jgi:hypothetical protein